MIYWIRKNGLLASALLLSVAAVLFVFLFSDDYNFTPDKHKINKPPAQVVTPTPTPSPTQQPTKAPGTKNAAPKSAPTSKPAAPSTPTQQPTSKPTSKPTQKPTPKPTPQPTQAPTPQPTQQPAPQAPATSRPPAVDLNLDLPILGPVKLTLGPLLP